MKLPKQYYTEPLMEHEIAILKDKMQREMHRFKKGILAGSINAVIIPVLFGFIIYFITTYAPKDTNREVVKLTVPDIITYVEISFITLVIVVSLAFVGSYLYYIYPIKKDLKNSVKIIEQAPIKEKKYMHQNNSYHFYIESLYKLSMEVSEDDYRKYNIGDEVNLEYSMYCKEDFGYF